MSSLAPGDMTSLLMIEARQQNTEVRLAVGKVADKVDQLASKVKYTLQIHHLPFKGISHLTWILIASTD